MNPTLLNSANARPQEWDASFRPTLRVESPSGLPSTFIFAEDRDVFAGKGQSCGIQLAGEDVEVFHCLFSLNQNRLSVQNCHRHHAARVNGQEIRSEHPLNHGDLVEIGLNRIIVSVPSEPAMLAESAKEALIERIATVREPIDPDAAVPTKTTEALTCDHRVSDWEIPSSSEFAYERGFDAGSAGSSFELEELQLLKDEIAHLQNQISERDLELRAAQSPTNGSPTNHECDSEQVVRLVQRLEQLLVELKSSDQRVRDVEELLRLSDEATAAEQEERRQIENWLDGLETRITAREQESAAERQHHQKMAGDLQAQVKHLESVCRKLSQAGSGTASNSHSVSDQAYQLLLGRFDELSARLRDAEQENQELQAAAASLQSSQQANLRSLEQQLAELELQACRERAELARQRADLERLRVELEKKSPDPSNLSDSDGRFAVMRQHLRERHAVEQNEQEQKRRRSLSGRIASLLGRVSS